MKLGPGHLVGGYMKLSGADKSYDRSTHPGAHLSFSQTSRLRRLEIHYCTPVIFRL